MQAEGQEAGVVVGGQAEGTGVLSPPFPDYGFWSAPWRPLSASRTGWVFTWLVLWAALAFPC